MISLDQVSGLVLCRAGEHRLAFLAHQVAEIEIADPTSRLRSARAAFGLSPQHGRALVAETGDGVVVDSVEVLQETLPLLAAPGIVAGEAGGALKGFVVLRDQLYPVLKLAEFSRYLATLEVE